MSEGSAGRRHLVAQTGLVLVVLLGAEVLTIPFLSSGLVPLHVGLGLGAIPAVVLKLTMTAWRMIGYYRGDPTERAAGPPDDLLRITAVVLVVTTVALFGSGLVLWLETLGPARPPGLLVGPDWILVHELSFIGWAFAAAFHALSYAARAARWTAEDWRPGAAPAGAGGRRAWAVAMLAAGLLIAALVALLHLGPGGAFG